MGLFSFIVERRNNRLLSSCSSVKLSPHTSKKLEQVPAILGENSTLGLTLIFTMVKLYSIAILYRDEKVQLLKAAHDLSSFGFFQRSSVQEFMTFTSKILTERTQRASRQSVKQGEYMCHVYVRADGLTCVLTADHEYPQRVSHTLITKVLDDFSVAVPSAQWVEGNPVAAAFSGLDACLAKYQNPREADALTKVQAELDETRIILHNTIEAVLERGEKLDDLVAKSEGLSDASKMFYTTARKTNSCCNF